MIDEKKLVKEICNTACIVPKFETDELLDAYLLGLNAKQICVMDLIANQPKVGEWIPCSERLPEDNQAVLTCKNKHISILIWKSERRIWLEPKGNWWWSYCMVEKWLPLPEPYSSGN